MKRNVWIIAAFVALALLALWPRTDSVANTDPTGISSLQQSVESSDGLDPSASRHPCFVCAKDPTRCGKTCQLEHCPGGCN